MTFECGADDDHVPAEGERVEAFVPLGLPPPTG